MVSLSDVIDINDYSERLAIHRLLFIARKTQDSDPSLAQEALLAAIPIIKSATLDTETYMHATSLLFALQRDHAGLAGGEGGAAGEAAEGMDVDAVTVGSLSRSPTTSKLMGSSMPASTSFSSSFGGRRQMTLADARIEQTGLLDEAWLSETSRTAHTDKQKLDAELKQYQSNLIKESCRLTHHAIAAHQRRVGDMAGALRTYTKAREYNSNAQHELECSLGIIEVSIDLGQYNQILPAVVKAETSLTRIVGVRAGAGGAAAAGGAGETQNLTGAQARERTAKMKEVDEQVARTTTKLRAARGLANLGQGNWEEAAREFAKIQGKLEDWEGRILASADIAIYLSLASLASWGRSAIKTNVLDNVDMRSYIDQDGARHARQMLDCFVEAKYAKLSEVMVTNEIRHRLDPHLASQLTGLQQTIRQRSIVQYFKPFATVRLERMFSVFNVTTREGEEQLVQDIAALIEARRMDARLDTIDRVLHARAEDPRKALFSKAMEVGDEVERANYRTHLRMLLIESGAVVERPKAAGKGRARAGAGADEDEDSDFDILEDTADPTLSRAEMPTAVA